MMTPLKGEGVTENGSLSSSSSSQKGKKDPPTHFCMESEIDLQANFFIFFHLFYFALPT